MLPVFRPCSCSTVIISRRSYGRKKMGGAWKIRSRDISKQYRAKLLFRKMSCTSLLKVY